MNNSKKTSSSVSSLASEVLRNDNSSKIQRQLAGSVLSQFSTNNQTGSKIEDIAARALASDKYNRTTKTLAGSALSQSNKKR